MTYIFSSSLAPATGGEAMWHFKQLLTTAGWSVVSSSDGSRFAAGDILSTSVGLNGVSAWFVIKQPLGATGSYGGVRRELAFQKTTVNTAWRGLYSYSASFTGSATIATLPTASDQVRIIGTDTAANAKGIIPTGSGSAATSFFGTDAGYRFHVMADNAPPYGFYAFALVNGGATTLGGTFAMDPMISGTFPAADTDPYVFWASSAGNAFFENNTGFPNGTSASLIISPACWFKKGLADEGFRSIGGAVPYGQAIFAPGATNGASNAITGNDDFFPVVYFRLGVYTVPNGYKGISSLVRWNMGPLRAVADTISVASSGARDYICTSHAVLPWDGTTPSI